MESWFGLLEQLGQFRSDNAGGIIWCPPHLTPSGTKMKGERY